MLNRQEIDSRLSRRRFLKCGAVGIAGGAVTEMAARGLSAAQSSGQTSAAQEMRTDVVVVGTGMGGLSAALRAQQAGARVIVLEKAAEPGGTTHYSNGHVMRHASYQTMRTKVPEGDPDVQRTVYENLDKWYELMDSVDAPLGRLTTRADTNNEISVRLIAAGVWVRLMVRLIESGGGKVLVETPMVSLLTNYQNEVVGALADSSRGPIRIFAKAVVLATGGWMNNAMLMQQHITRYFGSMRQSNASAFSDKPLFTGDGLLAALEVGAQPSTAGFDCFYGYLLPARPAKIPHDLQNYLFNRSEWIVAVNKFGRRFADEAQGKLTGRQMTNQGGEFLGQEVARQPDAMAAYIFDDVICKKYACDNCASGGPSDYQRYEMSGAPTAMANTLQELAGQMESWGVGITAEAVLQDITEYNQAAKNGKSWALPVPKRSAKHALVLEHPPFYAILGQAGIIATQGGIRVNTLGQVLHRSGRPIPGLYAAGVDIGNFSNCAYLGNLNLGAAYGYISGGNAAKQRPPQGGWEIAPGISR